MTAAVDQLLQNPAIWRIGQAGLAPVRAGIGSGFAQLDNELPDRGWPVGALTELLCDEEGIGELSLLSPALRRLTHEGRGIVLIAPARLPFARAWEARGFGGDEGALKFGVCV